MLLCPLDSSITGYTILSLVPSNWMKASGKEVTDAARESAETHKTDGAGRVGWNQAGSAADLRWVEAGSL
jgi:hypothetical protein